jgi:hypothetical protein
MPGGVGGVASRGVPLSRSLTQRGSVRCRLWDPIGGKADLEPGGHCKWRALSEPIQPNVGQAYSPELLNALINLAIEDAMAGEESSCKKCLP